MSGQMRVQNKFIWISGIVLSVVIIVLLVGVNMWFDTITQNRIDQILHFVAYYGDNPDLAKHADGSEYAAALAESTGLTPREALEASIYFTVKMNSDEVDSMNLRRAGGIGIQEAEEIANEAVREGTPKGRVAHYDYLRTREDGETAHYAFLNVSEQIIEGLQLGAASIGAGCIGIAAILLYIWGGTMAWIRPLVKSSGNADPAYAAEISENTGETQTDEENTFVPASQQMLREGDIHMMPASLSDAVTRACKEIARPVKERHGELVTDIQPDVYIMTHDGEAQTLCRILSREAVRTMRDGGSVHVDLLSDGREAGLIVRSAGEPWKSGQAPDGDDLAAVHLIARDNEGKASFEAIAPDTLCYTVRFRAAKGGETEDKGH